MATAEPSDDNTTSPAQQLSDFYSFCRDNEVEKVQECLKTMTLESINHVEPNGSTALHVAAYRGNDEIVKALLKRGASRSIKNKYGLDVILKAARHRENLKFIVFQEWIQKIFTQSKVNLVAKRVESFIEEHLTNKEELEQINIQ